MAKNIALKQMFQKSYNEVEGLSPELKNSLGDIEDAFDMISWGDSANGKTNFNLEVVAQLSIALKCKATYVSWEEGHGKSLRDALIRHNLLDRMGNNMSILDGGSFQDIRKMIAKRRSSKIWVFDSIQASGWTQQEYAMLKNEFVLSKKKKIFLVVSWADGKLPSGAVAKAVKYYANIKTRVDGFIAFPKGRYGGNKNFIIWEEGAKKHYGIKLFNKHKNK
jgi:hypothetical protein